MLILDGCLRIADRALYFRTLQVQNTAPWHSAPQGRKQRLTVTPRLLTQPKSDSDAQKGRQGPVARAAGVTMMSVPAFHNPGDNIPT